MISVKNVGRLLNSSAYGDVTFRIYNLIFGENGRGKTTLCAIFRSLQSGDPAYIMGRKTLGEDGAPEVRILLADGPATFRNGAWDRTLPPIAVYDDSFVTENVHAGHAVDTEQRRNLFRIIIGSQGVTMARRLDEIDGRIQAKNTEIRELRVQVERHVPPGVTSEAFLGLPKDAEIDQKIANKERELQAARQTDALQRRPILSAIQLPEVPQGFLETLGRTLEGVSADVEQRLAAHLQRHEMRDGEAWLARGLEHIRENECPFCGQDLAGCSLIDVYQTYFSEAYHAYKALITGLADQIAEAFSDRAIGTIQRQLDRNERAVEFWEQYCQFEPPRLPDREHPGPALTALREAALSLLTRKAAAPLEALRADGRFSVADAAYDDLRDFLKQYNEAVDAANTAIDAKKEEARGADVELVQGELNWLHATKNRHSVEAAIVCQSLLNRQQEKDELEQQKERTKQELDQHTLEVMGAYEQRINLYLDRFNAGFTIIRTTHSYRGRIASTSYQILINRTIVQLGDANTPLDQPSFKNTLSAGDRSTLALAFFLTQLEREPDRNQRIVILDDPFTSQDSFRRNHTAQQIKRCGQLYGQVIVLSHDAGFLKLLWDKLPPAERKALQLLRMGEADTRITEWDIEDAVRGRYAAAIDILQQYYATNDGGIRQVIQQIRPVLEGYCRRVCPGRFTNDALGEILGAVRAAGEAEALHPIVDDLDELNDYCRRHHHGEGGDANEEPIDDNELAGYVRLTLRLVGSL
ncbi:MAG TPA: AAA family ATPase [Geminicoccaceae bacterium]|nr:AAA family ATPase [Geminicoccaceae bacterium]